MATLPRLIRSQQTVSGSLTVASGFTGNKDIAVTGITDYAKCVLYPARDTVGSAGAGGGVTPPAFSTRSAGGGGVYTSNKAPELTSNTNLRFVIDANGGSGDVTLHYAVRIVEFY